MKNILKLHKGFIFLLTINGLNKVEHVSKLEEKSMETALLACLNVDQISIDKIIIDNIEVNASDILTPEVEDNTTVLTEVKENKPLIEDISLSEVKPIIKEKNTVKTSVLPFYIDLKQFALSRYNELKDSTCNTLEKIQNEILSQYGMSCTIDGLKNFLAI